MPGTGEETDLAGRLREVAGLFLRLGFTAFGGPAAHIGMMHDEVVSRRKWVTEQQFLDLLGASNLIPGPTSTEMAIYLGYTRAGWRGLLLGGGLFILPAMLIVLALAWAYVRFSTSMQGTALLYGVKPVIIAIVAQALWNLGRTAVKGWVPALAGVATLALYLLGANPLPLLLGAAVLIMLVKNYKRIRIRTLGHLALLSFAPALSRYPSLPLGDAAAAASFSLGTLFLTFLKVGAVTYGSGYVLLAFLRNDLVTRLGWLSDRQLVDAIAVGQFTPGPVFTTATFVGYVLGGVPGALLATLGIFLPSFIFVALVYPIVPRLRASPWTGAFLDGANVAALALMAAVTLQLAQAALVDPLTAIMALLAGALLIRFKLNSAWLVLGGAGVGLLAVALGLARVA